MTSVLVPIELVRSSATVSREVAGETIVIPICSGAGDMEAIYTFNELGSQLWHLLAERRTADELIAWVARNFDVPFHVASADVQSFLADLTETGLVEPA